MRKQKNLSLLFEELPKIKEAHIPTTPYYSLLKEFIYSEIEKRFLNEGDSPRPFGPFGEIFFPYYEMGAINSLHLFGLDELIIFSFYYVNKKRYKRVLDIGANIGLHSLVMNRCGFQVEGYEPDPIHYEKYEENMRRNNCQSVNTHRAAVSSREGSARFVRVLGNTTSSHLEGSKKPYGELETFDVLVKDINKLITGIDLVKMDVEGHEIELLKAIVSPHWDHLDVMAEIGSKENAEALFPVLNEHKIHAFSQKKGWKKVKVLEDIPTGHREGSLFLTRKSRMPWGECNETI